MSLFVGKPILLELLDIFPTLYAASFSCCPSLLGRAAMAKKLLALLAPSVGVLGACPGLGVSQNPAVALGPSTEDSIILGV